MAFYTWWWISELYSCTEITNYTKNTLIRRKNKLTLTKFPPSANTELFNRSPHTKVIKNKRKIPTHPVLFREIIQIWLIKHTDWTNTIISWKWTTRTVKNTLFDEKFLPTGAGIEPSLHDSHGTTKRLTPFSLQLGRNPGVPKNFMRSLRRFKGSQGCFRGFPGGLRGFRSSWNHP